MLDTKSRRLVCVPWPDDVITQLSGNEEHPSNQMDFNDVIKDAIKLATQAVIDELKLARPNQFMTPQEVADAIKDVDEATIRRWCRNGDLPHHQLGKFVRISVKDFNEFCLRKKLAPY